MLPDLTTMLQLLPFHHEKNEIVFASWLDLVIFVIVTNFAKYIVPSTVKEEDLSENICRLHQITRYFSQF